MDDTYSAQITRWEQGYLIVITTFDGDIIGYTDVMDIEDAEERIIEFLEINYKEVADDVTLYIKSRI